MGIFFAPSSFLLGFLLLFSFIPFLRKINYLIFCLFFFLLGAWYFQYTLYNIPNFIEKPFYGIVSENPIVSNSYQKIILKNENKKVLLYADKYVNYKYGDNLKVEGKVAFPQPESYANYLKKDGIYYIFYYPKIEKKDNNGSIFYKKIYSTKDYLRNNLRKTISAPYVNILEAVVLGERGSFSEELKQKLSISGVSHITAISGMHIVIFSSLFFFLFSSFNFKRKWSALFSLFFVIIFVLFVGASASAVRAGIMGGLLLLSYVFYRKIHPLRTVTIAATIMLTLNPFLLRYDLGFQLSFLAVLGIIFLYKPIKKSILGTNKTTNLMNYNYGGERIIEETNKKENKIKIFFRKNEKLTDLLAITLSAQIFTFPLIVYNFGQVPLYSVFANIVIVPLLPFIMMLGFFVAITGLFIFSFPVYLLLYFLLFVINFICYLPFSTIYVEKTSFLLFFIYYVFLFYKIKKYNN